MEAEIISAAAINPNPPPQSEDNIDEPSIEEITTSMEMLNTTNTTNTPETKPVSRDTDMFTLIEACERITTHYNRPFNLKFSSPLQIVDGCSADFIDANTETVIASTKMRFRNKLHVDTSTGELRIEISLSDITFGKSYVNITAM